MQHRLQGQGKEKNCSYHGESTQVQDAGVKTAAHDITQRKKEEGKSYLPCERETDDDNDDDDNCQALRTAMGTPQSLCILE